MSSLKSLEDGRQHSISQAEFERLSPLLLPVCLVTNYQGQRWDFGRAEEKDHVYLFRKIPDGYLAIKTPFLNPCNAGCFKIQKRRWALQWLEMAKNNPYLARVRRFAIDPQSFHEFATDDELLVNVERAGWRAGSALFVNNLCFIRLEHGRDEWLAIKGATPLGRMSFRTLLDAGGIETARCYLDAVRAAPAAESPTLGRTRKHCRKSYVDRVRPDPLSDRDRSIG